MTMDHALLLNQCFEVERSKLIIKIENVDIELKPETTEINLQTNDSELLGRINVEIEAKEPEVLRYNANVLAKEPKIITDEKEILAIEPEIIRIDKDTFIVEPEVIKMDKEVIAKEPKVIKFNRWVIAKVDEIEKFDRESFIVEPEIIRIDKDILVREPKIIKAEKEILAVEPSIVKEDKDVLVKEDQIDKFDKEIIAKEPEIVRIEREVDAKEDEIIKVDKEVLVVEPKIKRVNKKLLVKEPKVIRSEKEILAKEDEIMKIDREINTGDDLKLDDLNRLTFSIEPETIIIKMDENLIQIDPEIIKIEKNTTPVEYDIYKLYRDEMDKNIADLQDNNELCEEEKISEPEVENPLLRDYGDEHSSLAESLSSISSMEFMINEKGVSNLSEEDPRSILTWNVSGLSKTKSRRYVWDSFVEIIKQQEPDIVILQDVKLCSSQILGVTPRLSQRSYGGHVVPSYAQELQDANLVNELKRNVFKKYYCIHSLSPWRIGGQLIFIKNGFNCLNKRFNLNIKTNPKYHNPEGRCIILQFKSFYLTSILSPVQGWITRSVKLRNRWDRELAIFLNNSKSEKASIIIGSLNCAPEDIDLSDPDKLKKEKSVILYEQDVIGFPGSRDVDREGFKWILDAGNLVDVFRFKHPYDNTPAKQKNLKYTTLAFLSDKTRCSVRTDLVLMSKKFLNNVKMCEIIGTDKDLDPAGWRHLPQLLKLNK